MKLETMVAEAAKYYEQKFNQKPTELAIRFAEHILKVGIKLIDLGRKNAKKGVEAYPAEDFTQLAIKAFQLDPDEERDLVQNVADLWQSYYMDGYLEGSTK